MFKTFVINLDKDKERLDFMHKQLSDLDISYQRQSAILGKEYNPTKEEYDEAKAVLKGGHALLKGEIGCALSHARVLEKIVTQKIPYTLVLEDDVSLPIDFKQILEKEISKNKKGDKWEYLLFDYIPVGFPFLKLWFSGIKKNYLSLIGKSVWLKINFISIHFIKALYIVPLSIFEALREIYKKQSPGPVRFFRPVYFAGAYVITLVGAEKLLSMTKPIVYTADHLPNKARLEKNLHFRVFSPLVVFQKRTSFGSSILDLTGDQVQTLLNDIK